MAYTVLARKYRSRTFDEVIGQEPIATTLVNAIKAGRVHHGYLFTGTRGVGKTSMARILAKALNCLSSDGPTVEPCGTCDACLGIAEGQDVDVLEIDAASNTGVDNIRELRSNAAYKPSRARFKIYIIDEVHMLSTGAFNALLKTLEEPPEHVKFILATTEVQKVPTTIRSRCQNFSFQNIGPEAIGKRLRQIIAEEGAVADEAVVQRVTRLANGSMRDALSILDQLLSVSPEKLEAQVLDEILPPAQNEQVFVLMQLAAQGDVAGVLNHLDRVLGAGRGLEVFCNDCIETVRALMLLRTCGADTPLVDVPAGMRGEYLALSGAFEPSQYVQMVTMLEELRRNVRFSSAGRALAEALMVRFAHMKAWLPIEQVLRQVSAGQVPQLRAQGAGEEKKKSVESRRGVIAEGVAEREVVMPRGEAGSEECEQRAVVGGGLADSAAGDTGYTPEAKRSAQPVPQGELASAEERKRVEADPVVRRTLELFDGIVIKVERSTPVVDAENAEETE